jgi:hypothetical protein
MAVELIAGATHLAGCPLASPMADRTVTRLEHQARHAELHQALDELAADFIAHTGKRPSETTVLELMQWSSAQIDAPDELE